MTAGTRLVLDVVAGVTSLDANERSQWADGAGFYLSNYGRLDRDERRVLAPAHVWCMCLEPSARVREYFLDSISSLAALTPISSTIVAEVLEWLTVTGTDPHTEVDYVETFTEIVTANGAEPEIPLTPERSAPFVDVLRGVTSASEQERASAVRVVPDLLPDLRVEEQWGFTGVLARAAVVEVDADTRAAQLDVLARAHRADAVHAHDRQLLTASFAEVLLSDVERRAVDEISG